MPRPLAPVGSLLASLLASLLLALSGCSASDGDGDNENDTSSPDRAAVRGGLARLFAGDHPTAQDRSNGDCFAGRLVVRATPEQLREAGVLDASYRVVDELPRLPERMAELWVEAEFACVDFAESSARAVARVGHGGGPDETAYADCLRGALGTDQMKAAVVDTLTGDWDGEALARYTDARADCTERASR